MKLSMWIINQALKAAGYSTMPFISKGDLLIKSVRAFLDEGDCDFSQNNVYIGRADCFFSGGSPGRLLLASGRDMIFVENGELNSVLNQLMQVFDHYRAWSDQLLRASFDSQDPFQRMLDVIHQQLRCPMFIGQKDMHIMAITDQYTDEETYAGWKDVCQNYTFPVYMFTNPRPEYLAEYPEELPLATIPADSYPAWHFDYQIRCNCYCGGNLWGHFYVLYNHGKQIDPGFEQLVRYCGDCFGELLDRTTKRDKTYQYERFRLLLNVISGEKIQDAQKDNIYMQMHWERGDTLTLYLLSFANAYGLEKDSFCAYICETLEKHISNECVFPYQGQVLIVAPSHGAASRLISYVRCYVPAKNYICGVSYPFQDLDALRYAYFQARYAVERYHQGPGDAGEARISNYADWAFSGLIQYVKDSIEWERFIAPDLFQLYRMDKENGTEYYRTLFYFLENNGRADNTARQLFIHRNTLKYRMDKIQQVVTVDLSDSDVTSYLKICYCLMIEDYPLVPPISRGTQ